MFNFKKENIKLSIQDNKRSHYRSLRQTGFWGCNGAGCIILSKNTGRVLMPLRSGRVKEPYTWGTWGGAIDQGETPQEAVLRELFEETGYTGEIEITPLHVFKHESGFNYFNFLVLVDEEFNPTLNHETDVACWFNMDELPKPLHFGLEEVFANSNNIKIIRSCSIL